MVVKVTVISPTWKRDAKIVNRCLGCVRYQTYDNWEHLICSDGEEEPHIRKLVDSQPDSRRHYHNLGAEFNERWDSGNTVRVEMIKKATGDAICFYDDDNLIMPSYLETMVKALNDNPQAGWAICRLIHFGPVQEFVGVPPVILSGIPPKLFYIDFLQVLVRAEIMKEISLIETDGPYFADGTTFQILAERHDYVVVPKILGIHI